MSLVMETPRLILRPFCDGDLEPFLAYRNDPQVYRYQGWRTPFLRVDGIEFLEQMKQSMPGTPGKWLQLAIEPRTGSKEISGDVAFHITRSHPRLAYLGYSLAQPAWGQGYATEAVSKLLDYLFRVLDLHRVVADCDEKNVASYRLLERLGFRREAHYIESYWQAQGGIWSNEYFYALLQREWILR